MTVQFIELMSFRSPRRRRAAARGLWRIVLSIGNPDVAVSVDEDAVGKNEHAFAKTLYQFARWIEFED